MHFRDGNSRVIHHAIVRIGLKRGTGIHGFCGSRLISLSGTIVSRVISGLNPREDDAKFPEFSKRAEGGPSRASRLSKTFPRLGDSEWSRVERERGTLQSCSLSQDREILLHLTINSPCSVNPEFESIADPQS